MPINKEMIQPGIMILGSFLNVCGSIGAISVGADRTENGINPFFYVSLTTSCMYVAANCVKIRQIHGKHTEEELERRRATLAPLQEIVVERV